MSLETGYSKAMNDAVASSIASGVTYVVASGNDTADACSYSPSSVSQAITVGATNSVDAPVYYSNFGACVDLHAPGEGVKTIWNTSTTTVTYASGTSFASPYVTGVAALYLEAHRNASPAEVQSAIVSNATPDLLYNVGSGSPNLLLFSIFEPAGGGPCSGTSFGGTLSGAGSTDFQSSSLGFSGATGQYSGSLQMPDGVQFNLALEKKAKNRWSTVATSSVSTTGQSVIYNGKSGTYRWTIRSVSGSGDYSLCTTNP
jgi:subtilisin family serine protease